MRVSKERAFYMKRSRPENEILGSDGLEKGTVQSQESTAPAGLRQRSPVILERRQRTNKC